MDINNEYGVFEVQKAYLTFIKQVHDFCVGNNVEYSLSGGSLLGAIRHGGFIPWDDDMDIVMTRENYNKFIESMIDTECFEIVQDIWVPRIARKNDKSGMYIDILIFDKVPDNNILNSIKVFTLKVLQGMLKKDISLDRYSFKEKILVVVTCILGKLFSEKLKKNLYSRISQVGSVRSSKYICKYNNLYRYIGLKYPKEILNSYKLVPFENLELSIMDGYDCCLTMEYGDYMIPPDEKDRKPMHSAKKDM